MEAGQEVPQDSGQSAAQPVRIVEDPIARFMEKHWQRALYVLVGFGFLSYLYFGYQSSQEESRRQAAELFNKVRDALTEVETAQTALDGIKAEVAKEPTLADQAKSKEREDKKLAAEGSLKEAREKLQQRLSALSDVKEPYKTLSKLYSGISALKAGDLVQAKDALRQLDWRKISDLDSEQRFIAEMAALSLGRTLLDQTDSFEEGKKLLIELGNSATYVRASAALAYARVAINAEDRANAKAILEKLQNEAPQYGELVREQLEKM